MKVCFTGHRPNKLPGKYDYYSQGNIELGKALRDEILLLIGKGADYFICGGALGVDQMAFMVLQKLKKQGYDIFVEIAVPFKEQDNNWIDESKKTYQAHLKMADKVTFVDTIEAYIIPTYQQDVYYPAKMQKRNEYMVNKSDVVIAVWDGTNGGTGNCVKYAQKQNKEIVVIDKIFKT